MVREVAPPFDQGDFPAVIRLLDRHFGDSTYSLKSLFHDQQREILGLILQSALAESEAVYRGLHEHHAPTMRFLTELGIPSPKAFSTAAAFTLNSNLRRAFESEEIDPGRIQTLLHSAQAEGVSLDTDILSYASRKGIEALAERFLESPTELHLVERLEAVAGLVSLLPFELDLWKVQNGYYRLLKNILPELQEKAEGGDEAAQAWLRSFVSLGKKLRVRGQA